MTQKEAIVEALKSLGGRAAIQDIYRQAYELADFRGSNDWKATIRSYIYKETNLFRRSEGKPEGWWELLSYQEEIATRDARIAELETELERLRQVPTEDDFVRKCVDKAKQMFHREPSKLEAIRQTMIIVGRNDAATELGTWMDGHDNNSSHPTINNFNQAVGFVAPNSNIHTQNTQP